MKTFTTNDLVIDSSKKRISVNTKDELEQKKLNKKRIAFIKEVLLMTLMIVLLGLCIYKYLN